MKKLLILFIALLILVTGCQKKSEYTLRKGSTTESGFDTIITFMADTTSEKEFNDYFKQLKDEFWYYHTQFDNYNTYDGINNLKTINDNAGITSVKVSKDLIELLLIAKDLGTRISDQYNPTIGSVLKIWHTYREEGITLNSNNQPGQVPTIEELNQANKFTGWDLVEIDQNNQTVFIKDKNASIDLGGIAKGYATEKVALSLQAAGCIYCAISAGGNIKVTGSKHDQSGWNIGIQKPSLVSFDSLDTFKLTSSTSMVTSGDYQRFYEGPSGQRLHHLIDPTTLFPANYFRSVTIFIEDSTLADYFSTVLFLLPYDQGLALVDKWNIENPSMPLNVYWIVDKSSQEFTNPIFKQTVDPEFKFVMTKGIENISKFLNP